MKRKIDKKYLLILFLFVLSGIISWSLYFKKYIQIDTVDITQFPVQIGSWHAEDIPLTQEEYAILETRNVVARRYTSVFDPEKEVYLFIVYSQNNRKVSHPPEICYTGSGATVVQNVSESIKINSVKKEIIVNRLVLDQPRSQQISYYWFKVGDSFTPNYWKQQILIALKTLLGKSSSSALIRVSALVQEKESAADRDIKEFIDLAYPQFLKYLP